MFAAYMFSVILGGGFLLLSLFGDAFGGDADVDVDFDSDLDLDADHGGDWSKIFSFRTIVYTLFGFGAVGTLLTWLDVGGPTMVLTASIGTGVVSGAMVNTVFGYLKRTDSGEALGDESLIGLTGTISLPLERETPGSVIIERGARRLSLRALPHETAIGEGTDAGSWKTVVVVEMDQGIARVAPVSEDLSTEP